MADTAEQPPIRETASLRAQLRATLNTRAGLRLAIFMAEILAPSVAKRRSRSRPPLRGSSPSPTGREPG